MLKCEQCSSRSTVKNGNVRNKQCYKCKSGGYNFVEGDLRKERNLDKQCLALHLYLENMGFRAIGRVLGVSDVSALNWVRPAGRPVQQYHQGQDRPEKVKVMEFDQMWRFIRSKISKAVFTILIELRSIVRCMVLAS